MVFPLEFRILGGFGYGQIGLLALFVEKQKSGFIFL